MNIEGPIRSAALTLTALLSACELTPSAKTVPVGELAFDHAWIVVTPGAPQKRILQGAGFRVAPGVNRHEGQGTASITMEFENGFLELIWPDDTVGTVGGGSIAKQRFVSRMNWRSTGDSPIGIGFRRTSRTPSRLPFETWTVTSPWMGDGKAIEILSPRGSKTATFFIASQGVDEAANIRAAGDAKFHHPNGARRITAVELIAPSSAQLPPSAGFVRASGALNINTGRGWLLSAEFDHGRRGKSRDFRPELPLLVRY